MNRRLVITIVIGALVIGALVIVGLVIGLRGSSKNENSAHECTTPGCIEAASRILKDIDRKINPCDNFYEFACGGYMASNQIPHNADSVSHVDELEDLIKNKLRTSLEEPISPDEPRLFKLVKTLYRKCVDTADIKEADLEPLRRILDQYGKWPVVEGDRWQEDGFDWKKSVLMSRKLGFPVNSFFTLTVDVDMSNTTKYKISIAAGDFGMLQHYLAKGIENHEVQIYFKRMVDIATLLGADKNRVARELKESLNFEIQLANITDTQQFEMTIEEMGYEYSFVDWKEYINSLLPPNVQVDVDEAISLKALKVLIELDELLSTTPKRVLANYALWRVVAYSVNYLTKNEIKRQTEHVSTGIKNITMDSDSHRWKECVGNISESSLSIITNALYVRKYFKEETRQKAVGMMTDIREAMIRNLKKADWMDDETRSTAVEKTESIVTLVGYPTELLDDQKLEEFYADLKLSPDDFLGNVLQSNKILLNHSLGLLRTPVSKTEWVTNDHSTKVDAFYQPTGNSINLPAGILQGVLFDGDRPHYMNYGAIGSAIGHEFSHSFDPDGRQFDKDGNMLDWWTSETAEKYSQKAQCFINQYSNYTVESVGLNVDGNQTLGENVADNGGIKTGYLAYKEYVKKNGPEPKLPGLEYTPEQMFWISAANVYCIKYTPQAEELMMKTNVHSIGRFRVIGTYANRPEFSSDFNCPTGSYMNPVHKCQVL